MAIIPEWKLNVRIDRIDYDYLDLSTHENEEYLCKKITVHYTLIGKGKGGWIEFSEEASPDIYRKIIWKETKI